MLKEENGKIEVVDAVVDNEKSEVTKTAQAIPQEVAMLIMQAVIEKAGFGADAWAKAIADNAAAAIFKVPQYFVNAAISELEKAKAITKEQAKKATDAIKKARK